MDLMVHAFLPVTGAAEIPGAPLNRPLRKGRREREREEGGQNSASNLEVQWVPSSYHLRGKVDT